jgi:hypothetical protein
MASSEDAVFYLQDLARGGADQNRVGANAHPFISYWRHFKSKEPVVRQNVLRRPVSAWQSLAKDPVVCAPARRAVVGPDVVTPCCLVVVLIGSAIRRTRAGVPPFRFSDALIALGPGMSLPLPYGRPAAAGGGHAPARPPQALLPKQAQ